MAAIPTDLCDLLVYILDTKHPKEIEILSLPYDNGGILPDGADPALSPYFFAEEALGIPKKVLLKAFLSARVEFNAFLRKGVKFGISLFLGEGERLIVDDVNVEDAKRLNGMTKVMLLFDSEHQTAVNIRKRLIRQNHVSASDELDFLNTILTSPLPRHTKSPLLWTHRRFLIPLLHRANSLPDIMAEFNTIFTAGERHPKNYHAWTYARFITVYLHAHDPVMEHMLPVAFSRVRAWCGMNPSDISGWMFFLWFCGRQPWQDQLCKVMRTGDVVVQVVDGMGISPGHEAQWAFVRGALVGMEGVLERGQRGVVLDRVGRYLSLLEGKGELTKEEERDKMFLERYFKDPGRGGISWYGIIKEHAQETET